jgi:hypothetical protein
VEAKLVISWLDCQGGKGKGSQDKARAKEKFVCLQQGRTLCRGLLAFRQPQSAGSSGQSDWTHVTSVSNQQPQTQSEPPSQASQYHSLRKPPSFVLHVSPSKIQLCLICEIARNLHPNQMMVPFELFTISLEMMLNCLFSLLTSVQW